MLQKINLTKVECNFDFTKPFDMADLDHRIKCLVDKPDHSGLFNNVNLNLV